MNLVARRATFALLLVFCIISSITLAQDDDTVTIIGSRVVTDVIQAGLDSGGLEAQVELSPTGTTSGFAAFCSGEAEITAATRPISVDEEANCQLNNVNFDEYLIGYDVVAVVGHPELAAIECLSSFDLSEILSPSAQGQDVNWDMMAVDGVSGSITPYLLPDNTTAYNLIDGITDGVGLRTDATVLDTDTEIIASVSTTPGALGIVRYSALEASGVDLHTFAISNAELGECYTPDQETIGTRQYPVAQRLFVYANRDSASVDLDTALPFITSADLAESITNAGLTAPSEDVYALNATVLAGEVEEEGRQFSLDVTAFEIPASVFGTIELGGMALTTDYIQNITTFFNQAYPGVTINTDIEGSVSAFRKLCNGEVGLITSEKPLPEDVVQNCAANNIATQTIDLGQQAVVVLANAQDAYLECLTMDQMLTIWQASSADTVVNWSDVSADFPEEEMLLISPAANASYIDRVLTPADGAVLPIRLDVAEENRDPLYRGTAVANAQGTLTFMLWSEYQALIDSEQAGFQLVSIDGGNGCVSPTVESITDGSYPYSIDNLLIVTEAALTTTEVQSVLWFIFSDENYSLYESAGFVGIEFGELPELRGDLQDLYEQATINQQNLPVIEITPEAAPEGVTETE